MSDGFSMEELLPIVAELAEKYTSGESSSVTYERAQGLMQAVLYCINELFDYYSFTHTPTLICKFASPLMVMDRHWFAFFLPNRRSSTKFSISNKFSSQKYAVRSPINSGYVTFPSPRISARCLTSCSSNASILPPSSARSPVINCGATVADSRISASWKWSLSVAYKLHGTVYRIIGTPPSVRLYLLFTSIRCQSF